MLQTPRNCPSIDQYGKATIFFTVALGSFLFGCGGVFAQRTTESWGWTYQTGGNVYSSPAVDSSGNIYVGSGDNKLYALEHNGTLKWTFEEATDWIDSSPAIGSDGTVYVGSWDNNLYAIDPTDGTKKWEFATYSAITGSPAIGADGTIYFGSNDYFFYALESNGSEKWSYFVGDEINSSPAIGADGTIYFGDDNGSLHALDENGILKWSYEVPDVVAEANNTILSSPALDLAGNVYFGCSNGFFYSIVDNGTSASLNWSYEAADAIDSSPVFGPEGNLYFISRDSYLRAVDPSTGIEYWTTAVGDVFYSTPVVDSQGNIYVAAYVGDGNNAIYVYESNGTMTTSKSMPVGGVVDSSLTLTDNGYLLFGCFDDKLYAVDMGNPMADSDWPKFKRNLTADGRWPSYYVDANASPDEGGAVSGGGTYNEGADATITATPATGYDFTSWSGDTNDTNASHTFSSLIANKTVTANFTIRQYVLTLTEGTGGGVSADGTYDHGTSVSITATPNTGYHFTGWTGATVADSTSASTTITLTQAESITANFSLNEYVLVVVSGTGGSATGDGNFTHGTSTSIAASPGTGYHFTNWTGESVTDENASNTTITMDQNRSVTANFAIDEHLLTLTAGTGGTVEGDGNFTYDTNASIDANPDVGYHFDSWSGSGVADSTAASTTVSMTSDRNVSAVFAIDRHVLTVNAGTGGDIIGIGTYDYDTNASIDANPDLGYHFDSWSGSGVADSTSASTTVSMTSDRNVTANFAIDEHLLTLTAGTGGTVEGDGNYTYDANASIDANPDVGYHFDSWTGSGVADSTAASTTVSMTADRNVSAVFAIDQHLLTVNTGSGGTAIGSGTYDYDTNPSINANPGIGYHFVNWTGSGVADSTAASTTVSMTSDRNVTANFAIDEHFLTLTAGAGGTVEGDGNYTYGTSASIDANPDVGYHFDSWTGSGVADSTAASTTVSMTTDRNVSAVFAIDRHVLTVNAGSGGTAIGSGTYDYDTNRSIDASPDVGYHFVDWTGSGVVDSTAASTTVSMTSDRNVTANFAIDLHLLTLTAGTGGIVEGDGNYTYDANASINANPDTGYHFDYWTGSGVADSTAASTTVSMTTDRNVSAIFAIDRHLLTVNASLGGTVIGGGTYNYDTNASISATPDVGHHFMNWNGDGVADENDSSTDVSMTANRNLTANFEADMHQLILTAGSNGTVSSDGNYSYGTNATISATPSSGYYFTGWSGDGVSDVNSTSTTVAMTQDRNVSASFAQVYLNKYVVQTFADPVGSGSTGGGGTYDANESVTLTATASAGHQFLGWTATGGTLFSPLSETAATVTLDQSSEVNATAHFDAHVYELELNASAGGSVSGKGNYTLGQGVPITATPESGYSFVNWEINGTLDFAITAATRQYDASAPALYVNGKENPPLTLVRGNVYQFNLDGSTTIGHPFYFSEDSSGGGNSYLGEYTTGVANSQFESGTVSIIVDDNTPSTLYYYCGNHSGMGNSIIVVDATGFVADLNTSPTTAEANASYALRANFSLNQHLLTVNAGAGGSASNEGSHYYDTNASITATPDAGYVFTNWSGLGIADQSASTTTVSMTEDRNLTANFEIGFYEVSVMVDPSGGGSAIGSGSFAHSEPTTIVATPDTGYHFDYWSGSGIADLNASSTTVTVTSSQIITANFEIDQRTLALTAGTGGDVAGGGNYDYDVNASITATPDTGYRFDYWSGSGVADSTSTSTTVSMTTDRNVTAVFAIEQHLLTVSAGTGGAAIGSGAYDYDTNPSIDANPDLGYHFVDWTGSGVADSTAASTTVSMTTDRNVTANFAIDEHLLTLTVGAGGTVEGDGNYTYDANASINATPGVGYHFDSWSGSGVADSTAASTTVSMTSDRNVTAAFAIDRHLLTMNAATGGAAIGSGIYDYDTNASIDANPDLGYHFDSWSGSGVADSTAASTTVSMTSDRNVTANFTIDEYLLTLTAGAGGTVEGDGNYTYDANASINATPATGYHFDYWTGSGVADSTAASTTASMTSDRNVTANFAIDQRVLTVNAGTGGSAIGDGIFDHDTNASITATPDVGHHFVNWTGSGMVDENATSTIITMALDANVTANFAIDEHLLTLTAGTAGSVAGGGNYDYDTNASITATPDTGYHFDYWSGSGVADSTSAATTVSLTSDRNVSAVFAIDQHALIVNADSGGNAIGGGTYDYDTNASITAAPDTGYHFANWTGAEVEDENDSSTTIILTADSNVTANFAIDEHLLMLTAGTGGAVLGGDTYDYAFNASITATPDTGYHFDSWTGSGVVDPSSATTTVSITSDRNVSANFVIDEHLLILTAGTGGSVSGEGTFDYETNASISANPEVGYHFVNWSGSKVADENATNTTIAITTDANVTATFAIDQHVLTITAGSGGSVSGNGIFDYGANADITATPDVGYHFDYWTGSGVDDSTSASTTVSMTSDRNVSAVFAIDQQVLTVHAGTGGDAIGGGTYDYESNSSITATPDTGYHFVNWTGEGVADPASAITTVTMDQNRTVSANFALDQHIVTLQSEPKEVGTLLGTGPYEDGSSAELSATATHGYIFSHWSGIYLPKHVAHASSFSLTVTQDIALTAHFDTHSDVGELHYELNATEHEAGWKESDWFGFFHQVDDNWAYHSDFGWIYVDEVSEGGFWYWHDVLGWLWTNGDVYPSAWSKETNDWIRFSQGDDKLLGKNNKERLLYFDYSSSQWAAALPSYALTASPAPANGGTVSGDGSYLEGSTATLVATPADGFEFAGWSGHASGSSSDLAVTVNSDLSVTAEFSRIIVIEEPEEPTVEEIINNFFGR